MSTAVKKRAAVGSRLPNGATVIAMQPAPRYDSKNVKAFVALCIWIPGEKPEYATWIFNPDEPDTTSWGHYLGDFHKAVEDFNERAKEEL